MDERFEELLERYLESDASPEEFAEFSEMIAADASLAALASDRLAEHRLLGLVHQSFDSEAFAEALMVQLSSSERTQVDRIIAEAEKSESNHPWRLMWPLSVAASLLIAVAAWYAMRAVDSSPIRQDGVALATVLLSEDCHWASENGVIAEGQRLTGGPLDLTSGVSLIRLDGGAELLLRDETSIELISPGKARLLKGRVVVRAEDEAAGFRLLTPATELIDLGTEFSVGVDSRGATELNVLEGEVAVRSLSLRQAKQQVLTAGQAIMVDDAESLPRIVKPNSERFSKTLQRANRSERFDLLYAYDGFFYDEGELPLSESRRGKGWLGPWRKRTADEGYRADDDTTDHFEIVHGQMNVTWPVPGGTLGMLKIPAGRTYRIREMKTSIDLSRDGIYYFSFMVREPDYDRRRRHAKPQEGVRLTFRSSEDYLGETLSFGISPRQKAQLQTGVGVGLRSAGVTPSNQSTLWIGKIVARAEGNDEVSFRIFGEEDELGYAEPSQWQISTRELDLSARLNRVVLTSLGQLPRIVDELRIGPTWRSVTPIKKMPAQQTPANKVSIDKTLIENETTFVRDVK